MQKPNLIPTILIVACGAVAISGCSARGDIDPSTLTNREQQFLSKLTANNKSDAQLLAAGRTLCNEWQEAGNSNGSPRTTASILREWEIGGSDIGEIENGAVSVLCPESWAAWMRVSSQRNNNGDFDSFPEPIPVDPPDWTPAG